MNYSVSRQKNFVFARLFCRVIVQFKQNSQYIYGVKSKHFTLCLTWKTHWKPIICSRFEDSVCLDLIPYPHFMIKKNTNY